MSNSVSALNGASFEGFARVEEQGLQGMITLRGDLDDKAMAKAVKSVTGCAMPGPCGIVTTGEKSVAWMSPDELLILCEHGEVATVIAALETGLKDVHFLAVNVSDARAQFRVSGAGCREVLAKLMPVDFSAEGFAAGTFRRSRMAQVAAAVWVSGDDSIDVICFRSGAAYVMGLLKAAAAKGSEVGVLV